MGHGAVGADVVRAVGYEFWTTVKREHWGDLAVALIRELLADQPKATSHLESICSAFSRKDPEGEHPGLIYNGKRTTLYLWP